MTLVDVGSKQLLCCCWYIVVAPITCQGFVFGPRFAIYRGSYMSAHVLLNLLNKLGKRDKMRDLSSILPFFETSFKNSILQEHKC